jgi:hypothetical protein
VYCPSDWKLASNYLIQLHNRQKKPGQSILNRLSLFVIPLYFIFPELEDARKDVDMQPQLLVWLQFL